MLPDDLPHFHNVINIMRTIQPNDIRQMKRGRETGVHGVRGCMDIMLAYVYNLAWRTGYMYPFKPAFFSGEDEADFLLSCIIFEYPFGGEMWSSSGSIVGGKVNWSLRCCCI